MQETVRDAKCEVCHIRVVLCGASHSRESVAGRTVAPYRVVCHTSSVIVARATLHVCCGVVHMRNCSWRMSQGVRKCDVYHIVHFAGCMSHMESVVARVTL